MIMVLVFNNNRSMDQHCILDSIIYTLKIIGADMVLIYCKCAVTRINIILKLMVDATYYPLDDFK